ncbi:hypothetical protein LIA77_01159 [Sarocladium implicatum]|nr:hypothetical protein LIA77_01159 [Sarocladium implicatum]
MHGGHPVKQCLLSGRNRPQRHSDPTPARPAGNNRMTDSETAKYARLPPSAPMIMSKHQAKQRSFLTALLSSCSTFRVGSLVSKPKLW